jgi:hypothetical protein
MVISLAAAPPAVHFAGLFVVALLAAVVLLWLVALRDVRREDAAEQPAIDAAWERWRRFHLAELQAQGLNEHEARATAMLGAIERAERLGAAGHVQMARRGIDVAAELARGVRVDGFRPGFRIGGSR